MDFTEEKKNTSPGLDFFSSITNYRVGTEACCQYFARTMNPRRQ